MGPGLGYPSLGTITVPHVTVKHFKLLRYFFEVNSPLRRRNPDF